LCAPLVAGLEAWMREQRAKLSRRNDVARAMDYVLKCWRVFTAFLRRSNRYVEQRRPTGAEVVATPEKAAPESAEDVRA
jgi:hypothetical protein